MSTKSPVVALLTDFGVRDHYVGVMKGVLLSICPNLQLIDLTHEVAPQSVKEAAYLLWASYPYLPKGAIVLAIVDPGVGTSRRILLTKTKDHCFIAPDNGVLDLLLWQEKPRLVLALDDRSRVLESILPKRHSTTFHGRDIFAPIAANIACGMSIRSMGKKCGHGEIRDPFVTAQNSRVKPAILHIDRFGNIVTNVMLPDSQAPFLKGMVVGKRRVGRWVKTYEEAPAGVPCLIVGSSGLVEIVSNKADAALMLDASPESVLKLIV